MPVSVRLSLTSTHLGEATFRDTDVDTMSRRRICRTQEIGATHKARPRSHQPGQVVLDMSLRRPWWGEESTQKKGKALNIPPQHHADGLFV